VLKYSTTGLQYSGTYPSNHGQIVKIHYLSLGMIITLEDVLAMISVLVDV
jgi:hypothetical protein